MNYPRTEAGSWCWMVAISVQIDRDELGFRFDHPFLEMARNTSSPIGPEEQSEND